MIVFILSMLLYHSSMRNSPDTYNALATPWMYDHVDEWPKFPGGDAALSKYIMQNLEYPPLLENEEIRGSYSVEFIVQADGSLTDIVLLYIDSLKYTQLDREVLRVIKAMPRWEPGRRKGVAVDVKMPFRIACILPQE